MTTIRRINVSQINGNDANSTDTNAIRPFGETGFYIDTSEEGDRLTLMMFDGNRTHRKSKVLAPGMLFGSNADSGDNNGYDTIKLIPDAELFANGSDQYLIIDPTTGQPNHIHIRAGGTQDNSSTQLFIGGENSYLSVGAGSNPPVYISANNNTWTFDTDGIFRLPSGGDIVDSQGTSVLGSSEADTLDSVTVRGSTTTNSITIGGLTSNSVTSGIGTPTGSTAVANGYVSYGNQNIQLSQSNFTSGTLSSITVGWTVHDDVGFIGTITEVNYFGIPGLLRLADGQSFSPFVNYFYSPDYAPATASNLTLTANISNWIFGTNGSVTFPDNSVQTSAYNVGEIIIELDGITTTFSPTSIKTLLSVYPATGYLGSDAFTVNLPVGIPGQRLVVKNFSSLCTGTVDGITLNPDSTIEVMYTSIDNGWFII